MKKIFNIVILLAYSGIVAFVVYSNISDWNRLEVIYQFKDDGRVYGLYPSDRISQKYSCTQNVIARSASDEAISDYERNNGIASRLRQDYGGQASSLAMTDRCEFQELVASPVYLDVRYWQNFKHARIELEYEKESDVDFQIGYKAGKDFQWSLFPVIASESRSEAEPQALRDGQAISNADDRQNEIASSDALLAMTKRAILSIDLDDEYVSRNNVHRWILSSNNVQSLNKAIRMYGIKFTFTK